MQKLKPDGPPDHEQLFLFSSPTPLQSFLAEGKALMKRNKNPPIGSILNQLGEMDTVPFIVKTLRAGRGTQLHVSVHTFYVLFIEFFFFFWGGGTNEGFIW